MMETAPTLDTERLRLRSLILEDAADIQRLAGDRDIASQMLHVPHPYEDGMAEEWIRDCWQTNEKGKTLILAITRRTDGNFIGIIGCGLYREHEKADLFYWIGKPYWNLGYATEAAKVVIAYCFEVLKLNRIQAGRFTGNPASGQVLEKVGMRYEGCHRQSIKKWGNFEDLMVYGILKTDFNLAAPNK